MTDSTKPPPAQLPQPSTLASVSAEPPKGIAPRAWGAMPETDRMEALSLLAAIKVAQDQIISGGYIPQEVLDIGEEIKDAFPNLPPDKQNETAIEIGEIRAETEKAIREESEAIIRAATARLDKIVWQAMFEDSERQRIERDAREDGLRIQDRMLLAKTHDIAMRSNKIAFLSMTVTTVVSVIALVIALLK